MKTCRQARGSTQLSAFARIRRAGAVGAWAGVLMLSACGNEPPAADAPTTSREPSAGTSPMTSAAPIVAGLEVGSTIRGFETPWDLRFLPDGTPLVTERPGSIATVVDGQRRVIAAVPDVVAQGEGGLMGLALDPRFEVNRFFYTCYASGQSGTVTDVRVVRFRLSEDLTSVTGQTPIVTGIPAGTENRHLGCRLEVGPDGLLWITTGDAIQPTAPQDPTSRAGKVLRATLTGEPAPDNPGGRWDPYVYTLGHRNPQGMSFRPSDDAAFEVEHGPSCDDEINQLSAGGNYGWDPVGPGGSYAGKAPMTSPDIDGAVGSAWSSGCPTIAPSGSEFIAGDQWGQWNGQLAVAVLKDEQLLIVELAGGRVVGTTTELDGALGRLRTVRNAPDGSLWLAVDANPGSLVQVRPRE